MSIGQDVLILSKCAPGPVPGYASGDTADLLHAQANSGGPTTTWCITASDHSHGRCLRRYIVRGGGTICPTAVVHLPGLVIGPTIVTGAREDSVRMEPSQLVERDKEGCVGAAEDVAAPATVVTAFEKGEWLVAGRGVAVASTRIRLPCWIKSASTFSSHHRTSWG